MLIESIKDTAKSKNIYLKDTNIINKSLLSLNGKHIQLDTTYRVKSTN